jgi:dTDP-4-dehydrorhamnose reductase
MKVLLIGKSGQVGSEIYKVLTQNNIEVISYPTCDFDITQPNLLNTKKNELKDCDFFINTAAFTNVDKAEDELQKAYLLNRDGSYNIAVLAKELNKKLIHLSTDYVFSGQNKINYETDSPNPTSIYGLSKCAGEEAILSTTDNSIILRVSWVFGKTGNNFVKTILRLAKEREEIKVVMDQIGCPTPALNIAEVLLKIILHKNIQLTNGIYHYCGLESLSWFDFGNEIIKIAKKYTTLKIKTITPIISSEFPSKVTRPKFSTLSCKNLQNDFNIIQNSWIVYLENVIKEIIED